jgi:hypothetical protein
VQCGDLICTHFVKYLPDQVNTSIASSRHLFSLVFALWWERWSKFQTYSSILLTIATKMLPFILKFIEILLQGKNQKLKMIWCSIIYRYSLSMFDILSDLFFFTFVFVYLSISVYLYLSIIYLSAYPPIHLSLICFVGQ